MLIKEILETNDIKYDEKYWIRKTTPLDINNFIHDCIHKDFDSKKKLKVDREK